MFELVKNQHKGYIQIKSIAMTQDIPQNFLEKFLLDLKKAGLVKGLRGVQGGYKLIKPARDIKIIQIIEALERKNIYFRVFKKSRYS